MRIGILTAGDDCAGLNAAIRGVVARAEEYGFEVFGVSRGWKGLIEGSATRLSYGKVADLVGVGGSVILTSAAYLPNDATWIERIGRGAKRLKLDCLVAIGGPETIETAGELSKRGVKIVAIPETMDSDLTFGFDSAVTVAMESIDRVKTTGMSHERVMVVEVMGADAGWVAAAAGIAGGAHVVLVPEQPFDIAEVCRTLRRRAERGKTFSLVVAAEGARPKNARGGSAKVAAVDAFGNALQGGVGQLLAQEIEKRTGLETREVVLGHVVRGGTPTAYDRVLATRFGVEAIDLVEKRRFGTMVALNQGNEIASVKLGAARAQRHSHDELFAIANSFSGVS